MTESSAGADEPVFSVVSGRPTDEELAAVLAVLSASGPTPDGGSSRSTGRPAGWSAYWRTVRQPLHPGPGAWRTSAR